MNTLVSVRPSAQVVFVVVMDILPFSIRDGGPAVTLFLTRL
jgi:hypothetical protein